MSESSMNNKEDKMSSAFGETRLVGIPVSAEYVDQIVLGLAKSGVSVWVETDGLQTYVWCELKEDDII